ncbi:hypothetical protein CLOBOL_05475 [Enterocloster bolteae ATCC BAA-613]|uniref:Uncharacterized protein n=1 Tax=Enterocloster bolteae (strain ATCC BAA-613 / DSM 15670 / CCUG 46953 / JCM 12243 / WAL 16351) TaxID=411902 RepID=A8RZQ5_ENTBW|nr:hypothetical protein CLOBOL_05475 [Enterocloster bolteae ATCC BAA-613]
MGNHRIKINLWIPDIWNPETAAAAGKKAQSFTFFLWRALKLLYMARSGFHLAVLRMEKSA